VGYQVCKRSAGGHLHFGYLNFDIGLQCPDYAQGLFLMAGSAVAEQRYLQGLHNSADEEELGSR
jgi:hypothetical protein